MDEEAERELIVRNLPLVRAAARRLYGRGLPREELFQEGAIGLILAARGFRPERGLAFSTYAFSRIMGQMRHAIRREQAALRRGLPRAEADSRIPAPDDTEAAATDRVLARELLCALEERERELIRLRCMEGLTQKEAAGRLGLTQVQASRAQKRALEKLRRFLAGE